MIWQKTDKDQAAHSSYRTPTCEWKGGGVCDLAKCNLKEDDVNFLIETTGGGRKAVVIRTQGQAHGNLS